MEPELVVNLQLNQMCRLLGNTKANEFIGKNPLFTGPNYNRLQKLPSMMLSLRIVYVDHYLSKPISNLDPIKSPLTDEPINVVPVLRIFGTTSAGEKCCAHMHGFFPYLTVERESFGDYSIETLANELNKQLNSIYPTKDAVKKETNKIYNVEVIESRSFYGYKESTQQFLRFQFLNPRSVKLAFRLIKQGRLFDRKCNVYEGHITYIMQFFVNFKLSGMNFIHVENYHERKAKDRRMLSKDKQYFIKSEKQSICKLEIDIIPENIIVARDEHKFINPGLVLVWTEEKQRLIELNKDIKGIFKSNLKDCGKRVYEKKSLELNYLQQLKDYLTYRDNFDLFHQNFINPLYVKDSSKSSIQDSNFIENFNQSLSQTVIERIIQSEKHLLNTEQNDHQVQLNQETKCRSLNSKDIRSQEFIHLIKKFKNYRTNEENSLHQVLNNNIEEKNETDSSSEDGITDDELDIEKQARFTQIMLKNKNSLLNKNQNSFHYSSQNDNSGFEIRKNYSSNKEAFRLGDNTSMESNSQGTLKDKSSRKQSSQPSDSSSQLDPNDFNLNNESVIDTPTSFYDKTKELSQDSSESSRNRKRPCIFDDRIEIGHLVSLNDDPLFEDDEEDEINIQIQHNIQLPSEPSSSQSTSQSRTSSQTSHFEPLSQQQDSPATDNKSIFSFYSLDSIESDQNDCFTRTPYSSQPKTPNSDCSTPPLEQQLSENVNEHNLKVDSKPQTSTSTPLNLNQFQDDPNKTLTDRYRIRASLGTKFLKISKDESSPRTQSPLSQLPIIQVDSPNDDSLNRSNRSTQSKRYESSFTMNEKIQHLSESSIDYSSPGSRLTHEHQNLTIITMELFATTDHELKPNPLNDSIKMIFYMIYNDYSDEILNQNQSYRTKMKKHFIGIIIQEANIANMSDFDLNQTPQSTASTSFNTFNLTTHTKKKPTAIKNLLYFQNSEDDVKVEYVSNELCLIEKFIGILIEHDPDIITGFEIETESWGYLITRAELLRIDISIAFSRLIMDFNQTTIPKSSSQPTTSEEDQLKAKQTILNRTQCEEEDDQLELSDQEDMDDIVAIVEEEEDENNDVNPILNNNYLNRNKWETLEKFKQKRTDFGTIKTRQDLRNKVQGSDDLVKEYQTRFSLSWVSPCYMSLVGRIMLNLWRCVRKSELLLNSYTFENVYYHLFKRRRPYYSPRQLTEWYYSNKNFLRQNVLNYFLIRIKGNIEIIDQLGIVNATSELARIFGIQFSDVISKGSQFRVESLLYRSTIEERQFESNRCDSSLEQQSCASNQSTLDTIKFKNKTNFNKSIQSDMNLSRSINKSLAKLSNDKLSQKQESSQTKRQKFMLLSCNFEDRLTQQDPVIIPFIMEPKIDFYTNNVAVLDFQSLYPSIMIAYNYCYSTCLGKLDYITNNLEEFPLGFARLKVSTDFIKENIDNNINISPNGILFCNQNIRKGILSSILEELIDTRLMVKKCLKMYKDEDEKQIAKLLDARQMGLKLLANVTYGYTAAGFSGRMPMIDLADSIIAKGRETLINSINFINSSKMFGGEVIYGDTDSMFVEFKNTTREEAFRRAEKLCELITLANPNPIKLKLEKVYSECVLLSKKHYAGYAYDTPDQKSPRFETKGIETVRRDTISLVKTVMERSLRILFERKSINEIKPYLEKVFYKVIHENGENLHQYIYAKEYRGILGYRPKTYIPSMEISNQIVERYGEHCRPFIKQRVPYVISHNTIKDRLVKMVYHPIDFLNNKNLRINSAYYIDRVIIPPIQRVFGLLNLNIRQLYSDLPKKIFYLNAIEKQNLNLIPLQTNTNTLTNYFNFVKCLVCDRKIEQSQLQKSICQECLQNTQSSVISLLEDLRLSEINLNRSTSKCLDCTKMNCIQTQCKSIDCENLFKQNCLLNDFKLMQSNYEATLTKLAENHRSKLNENR